MTKDTILGTDQLSSELQHLKVTAVHGRNQEGLDPFQKILSRAFAAVQFFLEGVQTLLDTSLLLSILFMQNLTIVCHNFYRIYPNELEYLIWVPLMYLNMKL